MSHFYNEYMFYVDLQDANLEVSRYLFIKPRPSNCLTHCCHGLTTASDPSAVRILSGQYLLYCTFKFLTCDTMLAHYMP